MKFKIYYWFLRLERAFHISEAYLADWRGDGIFRADCLSRAYECERKLATMEVNRAYQ